MQLQDLIELIRDADYLHDYADSKLGDNYGKLKPEQIQNLSPEEFGEFLERVSELVHRVRGLQEMSL